MKREFKFRALGSDGIVYQTTTLTSGDILNRFDIVMQYTGLKDIKEKEIYEGDICRILYTDWPSNTDPNISLDDYLDSISYLGYIDYESPSFCIRIKDRHGDFSYNNLHYGAHGRIKVIGNIHENPELL